MITSCNTAGIGLFTPSSQNPWDTTKANQVYRRLRYGASPATINQALTASPQALIDQLMDEALTMPNTYTPERANWSPSDHNNFDAKNGDNIRLWRNAAIHDIQAKGLKYRMAFFWSNHFVTQLDTYFIAAYLYQYWDILQTYALGNFKEFTRTIGTTPAMLLFLNGFDNTKDEPNENYSRELFELFTLGENNGYDQADIEETSRAITGYNYVYNYTDHLNNIRLSYSDTNSDGEIRPEDNEILSEKNYYLFGLSQKGYNSAINGTYHPYGFVGKEEQGELGLEWLDFSARNYDPAIGRWMNLDRLAEQMRRHSPYNYAFDNPVYFQDPDGTAPFGTNECCPNPFQGFGERA